MSFIERPRLSALVQAAVESGIGLVIAPPGFGKTETVRGHLGAHAHYLSHAEHATVEALARALIRAVAPQSVRSLATLLQGQSGNELYAELAVWVGRHMRDHSIPIVLDDFHHAAREPDVLRFVQQLITATAPATPWLIISRETPQLPVGTWMANGITGLPLTAADLQFTLPEGRELATRSALRSEMSTWPRSSPTPRAGPSPYGSPSPRGTAPGPSHR